MPDEAVPSDVPLEVPKEPGDGGERDYTAFEKWEYRAIVYRTPYEVVWRDVADSFYQASQHLVEELAKGALHEDIEGITAIYLFRHYLERALKRIIMSGRWLEKEDVNADEARQVTRTHNLQDLWQTVLQDAKPKMNPESWNNYDTEFVKSCIGEFHGADASGMAFRYKGEGGEEYRFDFRTLARAMEHVHHVLEGISTYLIESHRENAEWQSYLQSEYGNDLGWV